MPRPTLGFSNGSPESIMAARFISFRTMLRIIKMEESGNGSKQTEAGWKFTICHLIHQNSTPRNLYGSIRARMEPTTDASKARRKSTRRWSKSLPECKEIQVKSRDIFNLFYSHHVPSFMSVCIVVPVWSWHTSCRHKKTNSPRREGWFSHALVLFRAEDNLRCVTTDSCPNAYPYKLFLSEKL